MKTAWVNLIIKITSIIQNSKNKLPVTHAFQSIVLLLVIILLEVVLGIVSFPLYLVSPTIENDNTSVKEYKTRRAITLGVVGSIAAVWLAKIIILVASLVFFRNAPNVVLNPGVSSPQLEITQEEIFGTQQATLNTALSQPTITNVSFERGKGIELMGQAQPNQHIFIYLQRTEETVESSSTAMSVIATQTNDKGAFTVVPDVNQFRFSAGSYQAEAIVYDPATKTFSNSGPSVSFTLPNDIFTTYGFLSTIDTILNISIFIVIVVGVILTVLIT